MDEGARPAPPWFARYAYFVLVYTLLVVLWGAFVRATGSGAGCGSHWPLCNGEIIPRAPEAATRIEFTHRVTSGLSLLLVAALAVWAFRAFPRGSQVRKFAFLSAVFLVIEALLGAGLVLLEYVAYNTSAGRAVYLSAHLVNTQLLLAVLALTAWYSHRPRPARAEGRSWPIITALPASLLISVTGAVAALGDTLILGAAAVGADRAEALATAGGLIRLRLLHPFFAVLAGAFLMWAVLGTAARERNAAARQARLLAAALVLVQWGAGLVNVILKAPVWMQLIHLLLANALWLALVVLFVETEESREKRT
ncbi:MAG: COX15/CtaA family protein [Bryobacteraceae bacterium]